MATLDEQAGRVDAAVGAILGLQARVQAAGPWALAELYGTEAEAHWGPPELLAHLDEMLPYWLGHAERIIDGGGAPVAFGRTADDPVRIGIIGRDRAMPLRELFSRLGSEAGRVAARMRSISDAETALVGSHPTRGDLTVGELFERFVTGHLEDHLEQLRAILAERGA